MIMLKKVAASLATWFCCGVPASLRKKQPSGLATHYTAVFATQYIATLRLFSRLHVYTAKLNPSVVCTAKLNPSVVCTAKLNP